MFYLRHYITVARCGFVHYILKPIMQYFFQIVFCHWSPKRKNFYNFGLSVTILDFQWLFWTFSDYFVLKLLVKWWKMWLKVIFGQMGTVNHFVNKNGRVAIFITTMADGGHLIFLSTVLIWNSEQCNKKWFSFIQNGLQRPFLWKTFGPMTTKYDLVEVKEWFVSMFEHTRI